MNCNICNKLKNIKYIPKTLKECDFCKKQCYDKFIAKLSEFNNEQAKIDERYNMWFNGTLTQ